MTSIKQLLKENKEVVDQLYEGLNTSAPKEDLEELIIKYYKDLPKPKYVPEETLFDRALSFASADVGTFEGERRKVFILGYSRPKDWNEKERKEIIAEWHKGNHQDLIDDHKVMRFKREGEFVAAAEIPSQDCWSEDDDGNPILIDGIEATGEDDPIPRDFHEEIEYPSGTRPNNHYGWPLGTKWRITVYGIELDTGFLFEGKFYSNREGDWANPEAEDYLPKRAPAFEFYDIVVEQKDGATPPLKFVFNRIHSISTTTVEVEEEGLGDEEDGEFQAEIYSRVLEPMEYIYGAMEKTQLDPETANEVGFTEYAPITDFREYLNADAETRENLLEYSIMFVDIDKHLEDFHNAIKQDEPTDYGVTYSKWDKFGIAAPACKQIKTTSTGNQQLVLVYRGNRINVFGNEYNRNWDFETACGIVMSFNTKQKATRYNHETRKKVKDPNNGDIVVNNILGVKQTFKVDE